MCSGCRRSRRAEDITQYVFLSALNRLRRTDRPIAFKPWIYEIARNACIDEYRRTEELASGRRCDRISGVIERGRGSSLRSLGVREGQRVARHLSNCQRCRREIRNAGLERLLSSPATRTGLAGLLPLMGLAGLLPLPAALASG